MRGEGRPRKPAYLAAIGVALDGRNAVIARPPGSGRREGQSGIAAVAAGAGTVQPAPVTTNTLSTNSPSKRVPSVVVMKPCPLILPSHQSHS